MHPETCREIEAKIQTLQPSHVQVTDNSHLHVGHAGAKDGGGHFAVQVVAEAFTGLNRIKRHRLVYQTVQPLFDNGAIHALEIDALTPQEKKT